MSRCLSYLKILHHRVLQDACHFYENYTLLLFLRQVMIMKFIPQYGELLLWQLCSLSSNILGPGSCVTNVAIYVQFIPQYSEPRIVSYHCGNLYTVWWVTTLVIVQFIHQYDDLLLWWLYSLLFNMITYCSDDCVVYTPVWWVKLCSCVEFLLMWWLVWM